LLSDRRVIIQAIDDLGRAPHMIVFIEEVNSITRHRPPPRCRMVAPIYSTVPPDSYDRLSIAARPLCLLMRVAGKDAGIAREV
jgi:hypothetical protein